jgi:hypothetical protein
VSEFHIEACEAQPEHFYHHQEPCMLTQVKADGWLRWLDMREREKEGR